MNSFTNTRDLITMAYTWNDDDRAIEFLHKAESYTTDDPPQTPLHIILRDLIWEQRDSMYTEYSPEPKNKFYIQRYHRINISSDLGDNDSISDGLSESQDVEDPVSSVEDDDVSTQDVHMDKIIENQVYRRFGYV